MRFNGLFNALIPLFVLILIFTGCTKEDFITGDNSASSFSLNTVVSSTKGNDGENECFSFVYPIELNFGDGTTISVTSDEEFEAAIENWFATQGEKAEEPTLTYPVTVIMTADAMERVLQDVEDLDDLLEACYGDEEDFEEYEDCFAFNYPLVLVDEMGNQITINTDKELYEAFEAADKEDRELDFEYPFTVTLPDGEVLTVNDEDGMEELEDRCDDKDYGDCITLVFPINLLDEDGNQTTVNDEEELERVIVLAKKADKDLELVFPVTVTFGEDGETITVNDEEELEALEDKCEDDKEDEKDDDDDKEEEYEDCFKFNFPLDLKDDNGNQITVNDDKELKAAFEKAEKEGNDLDFSYPFSVVLIEDGSTLTINNEEELEDLEDICFEDKDEEEEEEYEDCFKLNFPINLVDETGTQITVNNLKELETAYEKAEKAGEDLEFVFPLTVTLVTDGSTLTIDNEDAFERLEDSCDD